MPGSQALQMMATDLLLRVFQRGKALLSDRTAQ